MASVATMTRTSVFRNDIAFLPIEPDPEAAAHRAGRVGSALVSVGAAAMRLVCVRYADRTS
jgi:hypothetical protein